jgi:transposase
MLRADVTQSEMFSYRTLVDGILATLHADFEALYANTGRPSIPPERLLRASLIQTLYSIRSERQLVQHIDYNLVYQRGVGLDLDDKVLGHSSQAGQAPAFLPSWPGSCTGCCHSVSGSR